MRINKSHLFVFEMLFYANLFCLRFFWCLFCIVVHPWSFFNGVISVISVLHFSCATISHYFFVFKFCSFLQLRLYFGCNVRWWTFYSFFYHLWEVGCKLWDLFKKALIFGQIFLINMLKRGLGVAVHVMSLWLPVKMSCWDRQVNYLVRKIDSNLIIRIKHM